jgi:hypothetical protein
MRVRYPMPKSPLEWLEEIARAYMDAREAIHCGNFVGQVITEKNIYHMAPAVCLKFRGLKKSEKLLKKAAEAALTSYVVTQDIADEILNIPQIAFAFCYLAAHFGLDLVDQEVVVEVMDYLVEEKEMLIKKTS